MRRKVCFLLALILAVGLPLINLASTGTAAAATIKTHKACNSLVAKKWAHCFAVVVTGNDGATPLTSSAPNGYGPADFKAAYGVTGTAVTHIGIVTAYDAPHIVSDLTAFSKAYGLPVPTACTSRMASGCFEKVNQGGTTTYPKVDSGWSTEASLDVETAHGLCPQCQISLVEASTASMDNFASSEDQAVSRGAKVISNSYGGSEISGEAAYDSHFHKSGVTFVASSGDDGFGTSYPAASPNVVAVGGTSLQMRAGKVVSETAWSGAGSGCSLYEYKPAWQTDKKCSMRSIADVSADADPQTGAAIYDTYGNGNHGWMTVGGTSLAGPLVAGILASAGHPANLPSALYNSSALRDIVGGSNGSCSSYLCKATSGYDGPTGLGVLNRW
jgi:subtilase family serine protease